MTFRVIRKASRLCLLLLMLGTKALSPRTLSSQLLHQTKTMSTNSPQLNSFPTQSDLIKRVACIRCRTQKLKCLKSTHSAVTSRCDRCRKADVECTYVPSKPMGRPRTSRSRQTNPIIHSPGLQSDTTTASQQSEQTHERFDLNTLVGDADLALDAQNTNMFFDQIISYDQSDASTSQNLVFTANEMEFLTPCSSQGSLSFSNSFDMSTANVPIEDEAAGDRGGTATDACASDRDSRSSMQHLAKIGLDLHVQITKYQKAGDSAVMADLVCDVLCSSTDYLNRLLSLDCTFVSGQSSKYMTDWTDEQPGQVLQLDMSAAFQLLIPYVRLVQLHNILYRAILRCLSGGSSSGGGGGSGMASARSKFPVLSVGNACVDASDTLRARLLLQINIDLMAEIETTLELPQEARLCRSEGEGGMGSVMGMSLNEQGSCGLLRKVVSPRLLKTILDERNLGGDDVQSMRDRIAYIKCLLRSTRLHA
ncbi:uncharacterized protein M421DRAFT_425924 [Didymella exigua CBS 183.55]|uniref:Zn(2)-C6 fungal-type domain-containing protein n=1 Tax=Didymella exigua CBS 183.55 TaxID=1150837 RepID=A0A6A5R712_9PLEO|nr:uncharacterized protein M421DRAFT_425924 [Didymella exigua CBS 183.55]KAF1923403.1 hypothetical protein M421DRAFT_425924 [Didymella exigua CBS 183.55]